jgi:Pyruvate/2-oxoacid:ferredoxin oxidoreductase gamma subunit
MTARQNDFLKLYSRYRVESSIDENGRQTQRARVRRAWLLAPVPVLFGAAAVAEVLAATKIAETVGTVLAAACAVAAFALVTGIVTSASADSEATVAGDETDIALARSKRSQPDPEADDRDIADWVRRVEAVLGQADPGPDPPGTS